MDLKNNKEHLKSVYNNHEYIHRIRKKGYTRDIRWIRVAAKAGKLSVSAAWYSNWCDNYIKEMEHIVNNLNVAFGDNWDMHIEQMTITSETGRTVISYELYPVLLYPDLMVKNGRDKQTNIKDMIVIFRLEKNNDFPNFTFKIFDIQGTRLDFQHSHYTAGYIQSHIPQKIMTNVNTILSTQLFCIGSAEIGDIMLEMEANGFEENMFGLFLTMVDVLVSWESLSGVPHFKMRTIVNRDEATVIMHDNSTLKSFYESLSSTIINDVDCNFVYSDGRYKIKHDDKIKKSLRDIIIDIPDIYAQEMLLVKLNGIDYFGYKQVNSTQVEQLLNNASYSKVVDGEEIFELPYLFINKRKVELNIQPFEGEVVDINEYNVYPKFLEYVTQQLEQELYEKSIRSSTLKTISQH